MNKLFALPLLGGQPRPAVNRGNLNLVVGVDGSSLGPLGSYDLQQGRREEQAPLPTPSGPSMAVAGSPALASSGQESPPPVAAVAARSSRIEFVA